MEATQMARCNYLLQTLFVLANPIPEVFSL